MQSRLIALTVGLALALSSFGSLMAQEGGSGLSREQIEQGWIRLFDGESTFGWTVEAEDREEAVSVAEGVMTIVGPATLRTTTEFGDATLRVEGEADGSGALVGFGRDEGASGLGRLSGLGSVEITMRSNGRSPALISVDGGNTLRVRRVELLPEGMTPIFNGKDLSGWNVLEGGESVYSVTAEGSLHVQNGRGDIQTEGQYDDFILQLDVFSNGEHLNSGIFFRAIPGQFWSGYESQIRNEYEGDDRTKPVDYGTGAIYRRQAARRIVADDFEWFTKTIVAHDNHFAVWVDGYQVTDWTDDRPAADNGRNGYKAAPGVISIQGHDPTTDLSFRNIRIAELPGD
ncbi:3-keto-disaccharide hydrolase [Tautonia sociabilis]|uniref:DUF1080 domain-containing protein n=1 Tax=Tautonia sociabilis TaxID=2080755 RepID=A0A432MG32_9BACT|nr:DUF1080 domain-containing protein [Tautonia sociabilis]RUL85530.1 DUF1080 domain-containing protein [Tautonia sociabilis]